MGGEGGGCFDIEKDSCSYIFKIIKRELSNLSVSRRLFHACDVVKNVRETLHPNTIKIWYVLYFMVSMVINF